MTGLTERVMTKVERLLQRKLTSEEILLLLLAGMVEEEILEKEVPIGVRMQDATDAVGSQAPSR